MTLQHDDKQSLVRLAKRGARKVLPSAAVRFIQRMRGKSLHYIPLGSVRFGDLRRVTPISENFGWGRGTPIDRYYIEGFLHRNCRDVRGRVLEIGDNFYTERFGGAQVEQSDVLSVESYNPKATFVGDLTLPGTLPEAAFDCIIFTQTLQYMFDPRAAVASLFRALKRDGVLLLTVPSQGSQVDGAAWGVSWYWWFTSAAIRRVLELSFRPEAVTVETYGNVFVATAFHYGVVVEEVEIGELDASDPGFSVIASARAVKTQ
jgi:SAM-dependent methyltransferase